MLYNITVLTVCAIMMLQAKASNGEICCSYNSDGTCDYNAAGNCESGIAEYTSTYIDPLYNVLSRYDQVVEIVLIIEPDSLPNLATNLADPRCGNVATTAAYSTGIAYAVNKFKNLRVSMYLDGAHGGWLGWETNMQQFTTLVMNVLGADILALRGFATNVANYQPIGIMCPFQSSGGTRNDYCLGGQHQNDPCCADPCKLQPQYNPANNELNYVNELYRSFTAAMPSFTPHFVIDTGRNGVGNMRSSCANWCNIRGAGIGVPPTVQTAAPTLVDAYFWLKTPGESDGCTQTLPDGTSCPRFDLFCSSLDSIGSQPGEPRAPQAGKWFDYQIKQLAANAAVSNYSIALSAPPASAPSPSSAFVPTRSPITIYTAPQSTAAPVVLSPSSVNSNLICLYGGYCRSTADCVPGSQCSIQSQYYSQCIPDPSQYMDAGTGCIADYSTGCSSAASKCCNPGSICNINSFYQQCVPLQRPQCSMPSGFNLGPPPTMRPSTTLGPTYAPSGIPSSPSMVPSLLPSRPTTETTVSPSNSPSVFVSSVPTFTLAPNIMATSVLSTNGNQIVDSNGKSVRMTGINW